MRVKILYFWEYIRTSFWFIPLIMVTAAIASAFSMLHLDRNVNLDTSGIFQLLLDGGAESARSVLSVIAAAMLGVASTVFSITLVALTMASSQFGPRLLRNFMYDRLNQAVLGFYIAIFAYSLVILRSVKSSEEFGFVPNLSVLAAIIFAVIGIFLLIIFIHHISVSIQAEHVVSQISTELYSKMNDLFPEFGDESKHRTNVELQDMDSENWTSIAVKESGYILAVDYEELLRISAKHEFVIHVGYEPGDFILKGQEIVAYKQSALAESIDKQLLSCFILGNHRTPTQDLDFSLLQIVEIALRALSPGINDPFTAISCIDKLTEILADLIPKQFPNTGICDQDGKGQITGKFHSFPKLLDTSFNQIRQNSQNTPAISIRVMESLSSLWKLAESKQQRNAIWKHAEMIHRSAQSNFEEPNDLEDVNRIFLGTFGTDAP